jgi:hypothetical protein
MRAIAAWARAMTIVAAGAMAVAMAAPGAGAHDDGTTSHLWLDHIKPMKIAGTINDPANPVDWTKLKGVPAGFVDGIDNGVSKAGFGLGIGRGPFFFVKPEVIQRRIDSFCATGQAIKSVEQDGSVNCTKGPRAFTKVLKGDLGPLCDTGCTMGTLVLEPGTWAISAKLWVQQDLADPDDVFAECFLHAGGLSDRAIVVSASSFSAAATLSLQLVATLTSNVHASVECNDGDVGQAHGHDLSIMAIRAS